MGNQILLEFHSWLADVIPLTVLTLGWEQLRSENRCSDRHSLSNHGPIQYSEIIQDVNRIAYLVEM